LENLHADATGLIKAEAEVRQLDPGPLVLWADMTRPEFIKSVMERAVNVFKSPKDLTWMECAEEMCGPPEQRQAVGHVVALVKRLEAAVRKETRRDNRAGETGAAPAAGPARGGAKQSAVFAKGRVYDAWRNIEEILKAASDHVWIEDAYINGDVVSLLGSLPERLPVRVLTKKLFEGADPSLRRLGEQRQGRLEVKTTSQIHPRRIFVDQRVWESGDSLSQIAAKTASTVNEITSPEGVAKLQTDFESRWQSANRRYCNDKSEESHA
jgi:hypothetical protein